MLTLVIILAALAAVGIAGSGVAVWLILRSRINSKRVVNAKDDAKGVIAQAEEESRKVLLNAQEEALNLRGVKVERISGNREDLLEELRLQGLRVLQDDDPLAAAHREIKRARSGG